MKEKKLLTYFFLTQSMDAAITAAALRIPTIREIGPVAASLVENNQFTDAVIIKMAVIALFAGFYALSKSRDHRLSFAFEKSMQFSVGFMSLVLIWNMINIVPELLR